MDDGNLVGVEKGLLHGSSSGKGTSTSGVQLTAKGALMEFMRDHLSDGRNFRLFNAG